MSEIELDAARVRVLAAWPSEALDERCGYGYQVAVCAAVLVEAASCLPIGQRRRLLRAHVAAMRAALGDGPAGR